MNLPETITVDFQPYGVVTLGDLKLGDYNGHPTLEGVAIKGSQTSRLFHATLTEDVTGKRFTVYGIKQHELDAGHIIRVAM